MLIRVDASNAFNKVERQLILDEITKRCPGLARWVHYLYGHDSQLFFGSFTVWSRTGTQQGDPLGMLLFALVLHPLLLDLHKRFSLPLLAFYADDGTIVVNRELAPTVIVYIEQQGAPRGFVLNRSKTNAWWFTPPHIPGFQCSINTSRAIRLLGAPIGHDDAYHDIIADRHVAHQRILLALHELQDPQIAYHLLRSCAGACLFTFTLRTAPPHLTSAEAQKFDLRQRRAFEQINRPQSDAAWACATLPFEDGGLGLTSTTLLPEAAYISSLLNVWSIVRFFLLNGLRPFGIHPNLDSTIRSHCATLQERYKLPPSCHYTALLARTVRTGCIPKLQDELSEHIHNCMVAQICPPKQSTQPYEPRPSSFERHI